MIKVVISFIAALFLTGLLHFGYNFLKQDRKNELEVCEEARNVGKGYFVFYFILVMLVWIGFLRELMIYLR